MVKTVGHLVTALLEILKQVSVPLKSTGRHINSPARKKILKINLKVLKMEHSVKSKI